jgi:hypothetical protein
MESIANLMGCCQRQLRAALWTLDGTIVDDAALYAFLLHEGKEVNWKPECIDINMRNIMDETSNWEYFQLCSNFMKKLGYIGNEPNDTYNWELIYNKDGYTPVKIYITDILSDSVHIAPNYSATCCEFTCITDDLRQMRIIIKGNKDKDAIELYKSRGFKVYAEL